MRKKKVNKKLFTASNVSGKQALITIILISLVGLIIYRSFASSCGITIDAPSHNYSRVSLRGVTLNRRTVEMLTRAESMTNVTYRLYQGSYSRAVSASAGTHDGGGAFDVNTSGMNQTQIENAVKALRKAGFAAWQRQEPEGFDPNHIHAIAIGDNERSQTAKTQVDAYWAGRNGLANNGVDPHLSKIGRPAPSWTLGDGRTRVCR